MIYVKRRVIATSMYVASIVGLQPEFFWDSYQQTSKLGLYSAFSESSKMIANDKPSNLTIGH
jgi:hypothetical protein